jgi:deoxycytidine triphosphate deaminase
MMLKNGEVKSLIKKGIIKNGTEKSVEGQKYDFLLGDYFLKAKFGRTVKMSELDVEQRKDAIIEPGETVFVMTEEVLDLPQDIRLRLSPKRKMGHEGIIILGGLDVDPGYSGPLFVGMYNFSSQPFILHQGKKLIAGIFEKLDEPIEYTPASMPDDGFPEELINLIKKYQPINVQGIVESLNAMRKDLSDVQEKLNNDSKWRDDIREKINTLVDGLDKEITARKADIESVRDERNLKSKINWNWFFGMMAVLGIVIGILGVAAAFYSGFSK